MIFGAGKHDFHRDTRSFTSASFIPALYLLVACDIINTSVYGTHIYLQKKFRYEDDVGNSARHWRLRECIMSDSPASRVCCFTTLHPYNHCRHLSIDCRLPINHSSKPVRSLRSRFTSNGVDISEPNDEFFGIYSVILPPEPFVFGVSHITQRPVPSHILRPPYATPSSARSGGAISTSGDGRIRLGSSEERRLRSAARLARNVLEYAGTLVKVKTDRHCNSLTALTISISIASWIFWFPQSLLHKRKQHHSPWCPR